MLFDPIFLLIMGVGFLASLGAQLWVRGETSRWQRYASRSGLSGAQLARLLLDRAGLYHVRVEPVAGWLSDHYDPRSRTLRLSLAHFRGRSLTAIGVAAHEAGHALQHRDGYWAMELRQRAVPVANLGSALGLWLVLLGLLLGATSLASVGVLLFGGFVAFTLLTLPVEFDASRRALLQLQRLGLFSAAEVAAARRVLHAAAATYLAAALTAVLEFAYYAWAAFGLAQEEG
ncbi:MAG: zinc metallopeptidase [Myxococcota bacterium]|jgi:Zn-dependent membrane protease YugP|nr:zinc metallopeptidase [Myxococcota bacterium]